MKMNRKIEYGYAAEYKVRNLQAATEKKGTI
jgi:hypothetical protein